ncbi:MAG TPA: hypothetical protein PLZ74_02480 [Kiritimatiellia bacterium]|nr:hypothetical protein [Kiritimatiellia bacterium]
MKSSSYVGMPSPSWSLTDGSSMPKARQRSSRPPAGAEGSPGAKVSPPWLCRAPMKKLVSAGASVKAYR